MRILLDHCVPRRFGRLLVGHEVQTTYDMGWAALSNGILLAQARERFDIFITVDQNIQYQQNLSALVMPVIVICAADNRLPTITPFAATVLEVIAVPMTLELVRIESGASIQRFPARPIES